MNSKWIKTVFFQCMFLMQALSIGAFILAACNGKKERQVTPLSTVTSFLPSIGKVGAVVDGNMLIFNEAKR
jgi:hypothetical protein